MLSLSDICKCDERKKAIKDGKIYFKPEQGEWWLSIHEGYYGYIHTIKVCPYCRKRLPRDFDV